jgi:GNAT superfamily N-acetyltransferase
MKSAMVSAARFFFGLAGPTKRHNARLLGDRGETVGSLIIREATPADIPALARLHVTTWNATYAPMLMTGPTYEVRAKQWRDAFSSADGSWFCYVVERRNGELIGFAKGTRSNQPGYEGELSKIFLLREYQRMGLGRRLLGHVTRRFLSEGVNSMWLFADARNPSCAFYESLGAHRLVDHKGRISYGNYGWKDLRALASALPKQ